MRSAAAMAAGSPVEIMRGTAVLIAQAIVLGAVAFGACRKSDGKRRLVIATTTSVRDCGVLDELVAAFGAETGIPVAPIAVGSGEAMRMGRDGNADVLLVHDPEDEETLITEGVAVEDTEIMRSRFLVVGPKEDPAGVGGIDSAAEVFRKLAQAKAPFVSRGDDSGTHRIEKRFWKAAGVVPDGAEWYVSVGAGMMHTLRVANERRAYCLVDIATYLRAKDDVDLAVIVDGDAPDWANIYSVLLLSPRRFPDLNHEAARRWRDFLVSGRGLAIVRDFGRRDFGAPVFETPRASGRAASPQPPGIQ